MSDNFQTLLDQIRPAPIKTFARQAMKTSVPSYWIVTLVTMVLTTMIPDMIEGFIPSATPDGQMSMVGMFASILLTLFVWVVDFGYTWWSLNCVRGDEEDPPTLQTLFNGFSIVTPVLLLEFSVAVRIFLLSVLIATPLTLVVTAALLGDSNSIALATVVMMVVIMGCYYFVSLRYVLARYLLIDQEGEHLSPAQAIRESVALMRGWKWRYVKLQLSFLGWYAAIALLSLVGAALIFLVGVADFSLLWGQIVSGQIISAVGMFQAVPAITLAMVLVSLPLDLWLTPYIQVSKAQFYNIRTQIAHCPPPVNQPEQPWEEE